MLTSPSSLTSRPASSRVSRSAAAVTVSPRSTYPPGNRSAKIQQLIDDMFETMKEYQGVGLAAPQVHESLRVFVAGFPPVARDEDDEDGRDDDEDEEDVPLMAVINPE